MFKSKCFVVIHSEYEVLLATHGEAYLLDCKWKTITSGYYRCDFNLSPTKIIRLQNKEKNYKFFGHFVQAETEYIHWLYKNCKILATHLFPRDSFNYFLLKTIKLIQFKCYIDSNSKKHFLLLLQIFIALSEKRVFQWQLQPEKSKICFPNPA